MFSRAAAPSPVQSCPQKCKAAKDADDKLVAGTRQRAKALLAAHKPGQPATPCQQQAAAMGPVSARFSRYSAALPGARAARDLNELGDKPTAPVTQPCLKRLPLNAANLNRALGIDPKSPGAITDKDLRNDKTGYRSAIYQSESDSRPILVSRDTQPHSLADWKTNIDNGQGVDTDQYKSVRTLSSKLNRDGVKFDVAGYSKGGGLAQEAGLVSPNSKVYVFNSAGLNDASLARTGQSSFASLQSRTSAFSAQGDFLTFMNNTTDPATKQANALFLRDQLAGPSGWNLSAMKKPMQIQYADPADMATDSPAFQQQKGAFLKDLDNMIATGKANFPPVRAGTKETIPNSFGSSAGVPNTWLGANDNKATLGKLAQHQISNVVGPDAAHPGPMENQMTADRNAMQAFRRSCG